MLARQAPPNRAPSGTPASPWQVRGREERPLKLRFLQGVGRPLSPTSSKAPVPRVLPARTRPAHRPSSACPSEQALALPCPLQRGGSEGTEGLAGSGEGLQWASTPGCRPPPRGSPPPPPRMAAAAVIGTATGRDWGPEHLCWVPTQCLRHAALRLPCQHPGRRAGDTRYPRFAQTTTGAESGNASHTPTCEAKQLIHCFQHQHESLLKSFYLSFLSFV